MKTASSLSAPDRDATHSVYPESISEPAYWQKVCELMIHVISQINCLRRYHDGRPRYGPCTNAMIALHVMLRCGRFMNGQLLLTLILSAIAISAFAGPRTPDISIRFEKGHNWQMTPTLKAEFSNFLEKHLSSVRSNVKDLYWPNLSENADLNDVLQSALFPSTERYKNRPLQCQFVNDSG
jgi:hypothetical protein